MNNNKNNQFTPYSDVPRVIAIQDYKCVFLPEATDIKVSGEVVPTSLGYGVLVSIISSEPKNSIGMLAYFVGLHQDPDDADDRIGVVVVGWDAIAEQLYTNTNSNHKSAPPKIPVFKTEAEAEQMLEIAMKSVVPMRILNDYAFKMATDYEAGKIKPTDLQHKLGLFDSTNSKFTEEFTNTTKGEKYIDPTDDMYLAPVDFNTAEELEDLLKNSRKTYRHIREQNSYVVSDETSDTQDSIFENIAPKSAKHLIKAIEKSGRAKELGINQDAIKNLLEQSEHGLTDEEREEALESLTLDDIKTIVNGKIAGKFLEQVVILRNKLQDDPDKQHELDKMMSNFVPDLLKGMEEAGEYMKSNSQNKNNELSNGVKSVKSLVILARSTKEIAEKITNATIDMEVAKANINTPDDIQTATAEEKKHVLLELLQDSKPLSAAADLLYKEFVKENDFEQAPSSNSQNPHSKHSSPGFTHSSRDNTTTTTAPPIDSRVPRNPLENAQVQEQPKTPEEQKHFDQQTLKLIKRYTPEQIKDLVKRIGMDKIKQRYGIAVMDYITKELKIKIKSATASSKNKPLKTKTNKKKKK